MTEESTPGSFCPAPDAATLARLEAILKNPAYRRADRDPDWIDSPEMRGARLLLEYTKPQVTFARMGVNSTVVLFGGTRIVEECKAQEKLAAAQSAAEKNPGDEELRLRVRRAEKILEKSRYYEVAREFAHMVSLEYQGVDQRDMVVVTGGGPGVMEAGNRGAFEAGRKSIGLNITLPHEQAPNSFITPELCFQFRYFALRKMHFLAAAKALVAFPGGFGTLDELFETLCLVQTKIIEPVPIILVGEKFWRRVFDADYLLEEGVIDPEDLRLFSFAETAEEIRKTIIDFYKGTDDPFSGPGPYMSAM